MHETFAFNLLGAALLLGIWKGHRHLARSIVASEPLETMTGPRPSVTVIRPIRGLDPGAEENIEAAFATAYVGEVEILFVFDDQEEPAIPLVEAAIARHRGDASVRASVLIAGAPPPGLTGKLNAMIVASRVAKGELIAVCDSDTRPGPEALDALVSALLASPKSGSAFAPVLVPGPPRTAGDVGYALMLNALYGPEAACASAKVGELPFIMGQFMVFRREALAAIGGLEAVSGQLVDDMYIGVLLDGAGYHNVVAHYRLPIIEYGMSIDDFARTYRRWIIFSRSGLPNWSFKWPAWLRGVEFWLALVLAIGAMVSGNPGGAVLPTLAVIAACWSIASLQRLFGGTPVTLKYAWVPFALLLSAPLAYASSFIRPAVRWRGRDYALDARGRLGAVGHGH